MKIHINPKLFEFDDTEGIVDVFVKKDPYCPYPFTNTNIKSDIERWWHQGFYLRSFILYLKDFFERNNLPYKIIETSDGEKEDKQYSPVLKRWMKRPIVKPSDSVDALVKKVKEEYIKGLKEGKWIEILGGEKELGLPKGENGLNHTHGNSVGKNPLLNSKPSKPKICPECKGILEDAINNSTGENDGYLCMGQCGQYFPNEYEQIGMECELKEKGQKK